MIRVIPRDLFNDGNLLMNMGTLYLRLETLGLEDRLEGDGQQYSIYSDDCGNSYIDNVVLSNVDGEQINLERPLNSRERFPLEFFNKDEEESQPVFTDEGELTQNFIAYIKKDNR